MNDQTTPPAKRKVVRLPPEEILLADFRDLMQLDRVTQDKALMDQVCVEMARQRAAAIGQFIQEQLRETGYDQAERDAATAAEKGELQ